MKRLLRLIAAVCALSIGSASTMAGGGDLPRGDQVVQTSAEQSTPFQQVTWARPWLPDRGWGFYTSRPYPGYYAGSWWTGPYYDNGSWNGYSYRPYTSGNTYTSYYPRTYRF